VDVGGVEAEAEAEASVGSFSGIAAGGADGWLMELRGVLEEKRDAMHSWMCASRVCSPGASSVPQTGHSSSSRTCRLGLGCGGAEGAVNADGRRRKSTRGEG